MWMLRAHQLEALDVLIDRTGADRATSGQAHPGTAEPRHQRTQHQDRRPHRLDQFVRRLGMRDRGGIRGERCHRRAPPRPPSAAAASAPSTTSCNCGTLSTMRSSAVNRAAHRIGNAAFFAPEIGISPASDTPPRIFSLSMGASEIAGSGRNTTGRVMRAGRRCKFDVCATVSSMAVLLRRRPRTADGTAAWLRRLKRRRTAGEGRVKCARPDSSCCGLVF